METNATTDGATVETAAKHSPEPWETLPVLWPDGHCIIYARETTPGYEEDGYFPVAAIFKNAADANADRITLCVNAAKGLSDEVLAALTDGGLTDALKALYWLMPESLERWSEEANTLRVISPDVESYNDAITVMGRLPKDWLPEGGTPNAR